jgi:RNA polymerase sigma-70 factor (ECF subfamily)
MQPWAAVGRSTGGDAVEPDRAEERGSAVDEEEFDDFYAASFSRLVGQVHAMVGDRDEAQECVQEAFVRAWSHRGQLDRAHAPEAWVRTTAYRLAVSRWRRTVRARRAPDRAVQHRSPPTEPSGDRIVLVEALRQLPEAQRRVLVLHHVADLPVAEVAREVGAPEGTVKARLSRGRAALLAILGDEPSTGMPEGAHHA